MYLAIAIAALAALVLGSGVFVASRYKRCPPNRILVIFGKTGSSKKVANCVHGGGAFVWPLIQDYTYLSLEPMTLQINLHGALSKQNIRVNIPSSFTIAISTAEEIMTNAAVRLTGLNFDQIKEKAEEIIIGQLRQVVSGLTIEQINSDRDSFMEAVQTQVSHEINKIGLYLVNVNIQDLSDSSEYIESIGKKAAAEAVQQAKVDVAEQEKKGAIGASNAEKEREIQVARNNAEQLKGQQEADADRRIYVQQKNAEAIKGENEADAEIADSNAALKVKQASARKTSEVADMEANATIEEARAATEQKRLYAADVVPREIAKQKMEIDAEATAEKIRREARGKADAVKMSYDAEAEGTQKVLEAKAEGYRKMVEACNGDAASAANMLLIENMGEFVAAQVDAVKNIKIDKFTVVDSGNGKSLPNAVSSIVGIVPGLHEMAKSVGLDLPEYLGKPVADMQTISKVVEVDGGNSPAA